VSEVARRRSALFIASLVAIVAVMLALQVASIVQESQTFDEGANLSAGYSYWKTGDYRMNREHPPLGKLLVSLPLLVLNPVLPTGDSAWATGDELAFGRAFLYHNQLPAGELLFAGRLVTIALTAVLAVTLALWVRRRAGPLAALVALLLLAFDPNILANGRYVTDDLAVTLFAFLAVILWDAALAGGRAALFVCAGAALGAALGTKYSAVFLLPVYAGLMWVYRERAETFARGCALAGGAAAIVLFAICRGNVAVYTDGLRWTLGYVGHGQLGYLFGMESVHGWWWFFPAAFALKTPIGTIVLLLATILFAARRWRALGDFGVLLLPIGVYGALCVLEHADMGVRYLLAIYPFPFAFVGIVTMKYAPRIFVAACLVATVVESTLIFPNYLAFFNVAVGGPGRGPHYLLDSNIDWGQDAIKLKRWLDAHDAGRACVSYFGSAPLAYFGINYADDVPAYWEIEKRRNLRCYAAVSVTYLYGKQFVGSDAPRWLRDRPPIAKVGYSIYVWDFRHGDPSV